MEDECYALIQVDDRGKFDVSLFREESQARQRMKREWHQEAVALMEDGYECATYINAMSASIQTDSDIWYKWEIQVTAIV